MKSARLTALFSVLFILVLANLFRMQIVKGEYYRSLSERNRLRVIYLEGPRGKILDRNGLELATSQLSFNCTAISREAKPRIVQSCEIIGKILGADPAELEKRFRKKKAGVFNTVVIAEDIRPSQAVAIEEKLDLLPGFMIETRPKRVYPYGVTAAHITGFIGPLDTDEADWLEAHEYNPSDWVGREGIEKTYESYLRGRSGGLQMEVNSRGKFIRALGVKEPKEGKDIQLSVDAKLQAYVQELLESQKGAVMVMDLKRGGVLSLNSSPSFDPNLFATRQGRKQVGSYLTDENAPMMDRAVRGKYPPGSIFKIVTAMAALEARKITPATTFDCPGYIVIGGKSFHCWKEAGHGPQALMQALAHSCNFYFYSTGLMAGVDALYAKSAEFGFTKKTGIDLPGEKEGFVPSRAWKKSALHQPWYDGETANLAIGQGYLQVTPAQALVMIAAVATNGQILQPHLIDKIGGRQAAGLHSKPMALTRPYLNSVKEGLERVINSDDGTGKLARVPGITVLGKTGTAQSGQYKTHAWFVGYAPKEDPKVAMVVFLEHGGRGGVSAANLAGSVFKWLKEAAYL